MIWKIICILIITSWFSCDKEPIMDIEGGPSDLISQIPAIELISVQPATVQQFIDSLVFSISYIDGDGDLGTTESRWYFN